MIEKNIFFFCAFSNLPADTASIVGARRRAGAHQISRNRRTWCKYRASPQNLIVVNSDLVEGKKWLGLVDRSRE